MTEVARVDVGLGLNSASFETSAQRARRVMREQMTGIQQDVSKSRLALEGITSAAKGFAAGVAGAFSAGAVTQFASAIAKAGDQTAQLQAKLNLAVGPGAFEGARASAQKLGVTVETVAGAMARLGFALQGKVGADELRGMVETLVEMGRVAGATGEEINSALTQLSQGLAKGRLDGDELGSVLGALPPIGRAIAKEMGVSVGQLRDLGAQGKISADVIISAMQNAAGETSRAFASLPDSLDAASNRMANSWQALLATFDAKLQASGTYRWFSSGWAEALDNLNAKLQSGSAFGPSRGEQIADLQRQEAKLRQGMEAARQGGAGQELLADYQRELDGIIAKQAALKAAIDDAAAAAVKQGQALRQLTGRSRAGDGAFGTPAAIPTPRIPRFVSRNDNEDTVLAAARSLAESQRDQEEAARKANDALKAQGAIYEHLTDAGAKFIAALRQRPGGSSLDDNVLNTEAANRAALGGREYSTLDQRVLATERSNRDAAKKILAEQTKDQLEQTRRLADLQSDILIEPWRNMADQVSGIADDMFGDLLDKGEISGKALGETFTKSINSSLANLGSTLVTAPLQKAIAEIGAGSYSGIGDFISKHQTLAAGTAGVVAGQVGGQLLGLQGKYSGLGGTVGALAGGMFGPLGAAAGGFLGSIGGGLFGAENNLGNDRSTQAYSTRAGKIVYGDKSFSAGNRSVTSGILGEVQGLQEALGDLGATFKNINLRVEAGNKSGISVNGKKYDTADEALRGAIEQLLKARTGGLTATQQTILANTKGKNASAIGQDLAFGETYDRLVAGGNQYDQALKDLNQSYDQAIVQANKLKLDTAGLTAARARETAEIERQRDQATRGVRSQLAHLSGNDGLQQQLLDLDTQMRELAKAAADLGIPLDEVTKAHQDAAKKIVEAWQDNLNDLVRQQRDAAQGIVEAQRATVGAVDQFLDPIKQALGSQGIGKGVYSGVATTAGALDEFRAMLTAAQGGDVKALSGLTGAGQAAVQAARETYGSGAEFAAIYKEIEAGLKAEQGELEAKRDQVLREIGNFSEQTVDELIRLRKESLQQQRELFEQLGRDIRAAIEGAR